MDCMYPARYLCPLGSTGKNTGVHCRALLQGIFLTQGSNLPSCDAPSLAGGFFALSHQGRPLGAIIMPNSDCEISIPLPEHLLCPFYDL